MGKKPKSDAIIDPESNGDVQRSTDHVIAPEKKTPKLDTSKWPLLLKVSYALCTGCKLSMMACKGITHVAMLLACFQDGSVHVHV